MQNEQKSQFQVGTKFTKNGLVNNGVVYTIVQITNTRVIYTDGKKHKCGATNISKSRAWLTVDGFNERVKSGRVIIFE